MREEGPGVYLSLAEKGSEPAVQTKNDSAATRLLVAINLPQPTMEPTSDQGRAFAEKMLAVFRQMIEEGAGRFSMGGRYPLYLKLDSVSLGVLSTDEISDYNIQIDFEVNTSQIVDLIILDNQLTHLRACLEQAIREYNTR